MELKLVDSKKMKSLEDYLIALVTGLISLKTLQAFHERAVNIGILKEDQECRANTIVWDFKRLEKLYFEQAESVRELVPEDFTLDSFVDKFNGEVKAIRRKRKDGSI